MEARPARLQGCPVLTILVAFTGTACLVWYLRKYVYRIDPILPHLGRYLARVYAALMAWNDRMNRRYWKEEDGTR